MVTVQYRIKRLPPSTIDGESLILETIYTSHDKVEIDLIEKHYKDDIGDDLIQRVEVKEQEHD